MAILVPPPLDPSSQEVLYRHVNPDWLDDGEPTSQAFKPFDASNIHLSVDLSSKVTSAEQSHNFYTKTLGNPSAGVWGVTPAECAEASLAAYAAPTATNPAHGAIDFTGIDLKKEARRRGKKLASRARERKRIYPKLEDASAVATSGSGGAADPSDTAPLEG